MPSSAVEEAAHREADALLRHFEGIVRHAGAQLELDVVAEISRARCIIRGGTIDATDVVHLREYMAAREIFYASLAPAPAPSYWAELQYFQLDHVAVLDSYLRECADECAYELCLAKCDRKDRDAVRTAVRTAVGALLYFAGRTASIRSFVQVDMHCFAPSDPLIVDTTRRLHAKLLNKIESVATCPECKLVVAPPPDAA